MDDRLHPTQTNCRHHGGPSDCDEFSEMPGGVVGYKSFSGSNKPGTVIHQTHTDGISAASQDKYLNAMTR
jgi:hypothetical protein